MIFPRWRNLDAQSMRFLCSNSRQGLVGLLHSYLVMNPLMIKIQSSANHLNGFFTAVYLIFALIMTATVGFPDYYQTGSQKLMDRSPAGGPIVRQMTPPQYIYTWVRIGALQKIYQKNPTGDGGILNFFNSLDPAQHPAGKESAFIQNWPQFKNRSAIFAWTNPALSVVGSGGSEEYGELLLRLEISPKALTFHVKRSEEIGMQYRQQMSELPAQAHRADLILHEGSVREFVLLNPSAITNFSMDPEDMRPYLEEQIRRLKDPKETFEVEELHARGFGDPIGKDQPTFGPKGNERMYALFRLENFLSRGRQLIPPGFLKSAQVGSSSGPLEPYIQASNAYFAVEREEKRRSETFYLNSYSRVSKATWIYYFQEAEDTGTYIDSIEKAQNLLKYRLENHLKLSKQDAIDILKPIAAKSANLQVQMLNTGKFPHAVDINSFYEFFQSVLNESFSIHEVMNLFGKAYFMTDLMPAVISKITSASQKSSSHKNVMCKEVFQLKN
jgi:hypothetical protein